jgi:hypothetical protein
LNCGIGSSSLKAEVKAFDRLQIVRDRNSSYFGSNAEGIVTRSCVAELPAIPIPIRKILSFLEQHYTA